MVRLSTFEIAKRNIRRRPLRSFCLIAAVMLFSFVLFSGTVLSISLSSGASSMAGRLGADIIAVPEGFDPHIDSVILTGKPSMFYMPKDALEKLATIDGIEKMSPQTFLATVRASCCSYPLQIIGVDYESDFVIKPWLDSTLRRELKDGELIVGYRVNGKVGEKLHFFGVDLPVVARLGQSGMGFDTAVFVTRKTAADLAKAGEKIFSHPLTDDGSLISTVMLQLEPGYDSVKVAREINKKLSAEGIFALFSKKFVNSISSSLRIVSWLIRSAVILVWLLAVAVIALLFSVSLRERWAEMGVLRAIGATRKKLAYLVLAESVIDCAAGALLGVALGAVGVVTVSPMVVETLKLPFLLPNFSSVVVLAIITIIVTVATGALGALGTAIKAGKADISSTVRGL